MLTVSYDGTNFNGSQRQGTHRTVQAEVERALSELWSREARATFAGRTDTGVHAAGQVVSSEDFRPDLEVWQLRKAINARLPADISIVELVRRPIEFHARFDARWREYRYRVWTGARQPLLSRQVVQRERELDSGMMSDAARLLIGEHDFAAFAGNGEGMSWSGRASTEQGTVRTVLACEVRTISPWWCENAGAGKLVEIRVTATGFLPKMVRAIAGTLMEIGYGEQQVEWVTELIAGRDRRLAGGSAPAHGLIFWRVGYAGDLLPGAGPAGTD